MDTGTKEASAPSYPASRLIIAALIPLGTFVLQDFFWSAITPYVWFLFYPAVFFSAWVGGLWGGIASTVISTLLVWWYFIPLRHSFALERPISVISIAIFAFLGVLVSLTHGRLRRANLETERALGALKGVNDHLEERIGERTADLGRTLAALRQSEAKLLRLNEELEERVRERTLQLEAANKELEAFSYSVSHDLKAPLRGIDGYSQLLEKEHGDRLDEEGRLFIRNVRNSAAQMHQLIEDLLNYSRVERRSLQSMNLDLAALVQAVTEERQAELEEAGVLLSIELPRVTVRGDRDGLAMVLRNLLGNAIKFSRDALPPTVQIGSRLEDGCAVLWVRDNGIGFDMKFHDRIFDIFQRLQRVEEYPGTGVGLALVRKAMQRMGGRVWADSTPGQGATFYLEIPL